VGLRRVSVGSLVIRAPTITTLDDLSVIKVDFRAGEFSAGLRDRSQGEGDGCRFPGRDFLAQSRAWIRASIRESLRHGRAACQTRTRAEAGMFPQRTLARDEHQALMVLKPALVRSKVGSYPLRHRDGRATRREVRIGGRSLAGRIVSGLKVGEQ